MTHYQVRLRPRFTFWRTVRFGWLPLLLGLAGLGAVHVIKKASPETADSLPLQFLPLLVVACAVPLAYLWWGRGPKLTIANSTLTLGGDQAPLANLAPRIEEFVHYVHARVGGGRFWQLMLVLTLPTGEQGVLCRGGGGRASKRPLSRARPAYELDPGDWEALTRALGLPPR